MSNLEVPIIPTFLKTVNSYRVALPMILGIFGLVNLLNPLLQDSYADIFSGHYLWDPVVGALAGSISFGIPLTSYVIGGELLRQGVSLIAITAFILTWSTVGVVMLPLEAKYLGRRYAITRNIINFAFAIIIAVLTVVILDFINGL